MHRLARSLSAACCALALASAGTSAAPDGGGGSSGGIRVDVPVVLKEAKVVFNLDHAAFAGDEPVGLDFLRVMVARFRADETKARIVAIFHGDFGYALLNDGAYDRVRNWRRGNPYKDQIAALIRDGVQIEECGETMRINRWSNEDLLPSVRVDTGANFRIIELVQEGYVQIQP